jgi:hypothetical protein
MEWEGMNGLDGMDVDGWMGLMTAHVSGTASLYCTSGRDRKNTVGTRMGLWSLAN